MLKLKKVLSLSINISSIILIIFSFLQVIVRHIPHISIVYTEEIATFSLIYITFLGAAINVKDDGHFRLGFVEHLLATKQKKYFNLFVDLVLSCIVIIIIWSGSIYTLNGINRVFPMTGFKKVWIYIVIPISGIMMILFLVDKLINSIKNK